MADAKATVAPNQPLPTWQQALKVWLRIGLLSFGGPAAQIALMHREIVAERGWLNEKQYLGALNFCMLLPGPEAMQLATYAGWRLHGWLGGLAAGLLFVLPGALIILILSTIYVIYGDLSLIKALFLGVKAAVVVIVLEALLRVSKRTLRKPQHWIIAILAFIAIFFFSLPYPLIIAGAAGYGCFFLAASDGGEIVSQKISPLRTLMTIAVWLAIWWIPILAFGYFVNDALLQEIGLFFSKLAVVTFGGAYAVLAYIAQDVVGHYGWLSVGEMMDGLGFAETTPGPLILVTEFVGFLAAYAKGGFWYGVLGAVITLWVTFVPCFLWIFAGAPYIEWIIDRPRWHGALSAITAAVVGMILNLSLWFALHVFFADLSTWNYWAFKLLLPTWETLNWQVVALTLLCAVLLFKYRLGIVRLLLFASSLGMALSLVSGSL